MENFGKISDFVTSLDSLNHLIKISVNKDIFNKS